MTSGEFWNVDVDYHQFVINASETSSTTLYVTGGPLVHAGDDTVLTVMTGIDAGDVHVRASARSGPPPAGELTGWDAAEESTVWCPDGEITISGLMCGPIDPAPGLAPSGPGLYRVQVRARGRRPAHEKYDDDGELRLPLEEFEILTWPVSEDIGHRILAEDGIDPRWEPHPDQAAMNAVFGLLTGSCADPFDPYAYQPPPPRPWPDDLPRFDVVRSIAVPDDAGRGGDAGRGDLSAALLGDPRWLGRCHSDGSSRGAPRSWRLVTGPLQVTLTPSAEGPARARPETDASRLTLSWQWGRVDPIPPDPDDPAQAFAASLVIPDTHASQVELTLSPTDGGQRRLEVRHRGVPACDAVLLGLLWEYLLTRAADDAAGRPPTSELPWDATLDRLTRQS